MSSPEKDVKVTRRRFVKRAAAGTAAAVGAGLLAGCTQTPQIVKETVQVPVEVIKEVTVAAPAAAEGQAGGPVTLEVFDPFGPAEVTALFAPRLDTLEGKTIAYAEGTWMVGTAKPLVLGLLQQMYPTLKVVDIPQYGEIQNMKPDALAAMLKEKNLDAVIVGNAG